MTRQFKFNGYHDKPYYGDGKFTKGKVYQATGVDEYLNSVHPLHPDARFDDDNGKDCIEELHYFTEVIDG